MELSDLCTPALVYFFISVISIIILISNSINVISIIIKMIFTLLWTYVLHMICAKGYTGVSWALVLIPYVIMFGVMAAFLDLTTKLVPYLGQTVINNASYQQK